MKQQKLPSIVTLIILTTIASLFWLGFSVYRVVANKPAPDLPPEILAPINPTLDTAAIDKIQKALFYDESQIQTLIITSPIALPTITPSLSPSPAPSASGSGTPSATSSPTATPQGGI